MSVVLNKIKRIIFTLDADGDGVGAPVAFECQVRSWTVTPPQEDGERIYTQCPEGEVIEDPDDVWTLEVTLLADWNVSGVSDFLYTNAGKVVPFVLQHHPDDPNQHVQWDGKVKLKAPPAGGAGRAREEHPSVTFPGVGPFNYSRGV